MKYILNTSFFACFYIDVHFFLKLSRHLSIVLQVQSMHCFSVLWITVLEVMLQVVSLLVEEVPCFKY